MVEQQETSSKRIKLDFASKSSGPSYGPSDVVRRTLHDASSGVSSGAKTIKPNKNAKHLVQ